MKTFALWLRERFSTWVDKHGEDFFLSMVIYSFIVGGAFILVDTNPSAEGFRFGWLYTLLRLPTYTIVALTILLIAWIMAALGWMWLCDQYKDYQKFAAKLRERKDTDGHS